jgi:hypothetical protein
LNDNESPEGRSIEWPEIIAGLRAAGEVFQETYGDQIAAFQQFVTELNAGVRAWVAEHEAELRHISDGVAGFLKNLPEWQKNLEANLALLERSLKLLEESGHKGAGYILSVYEVAQLAELSPEALETRLFEETSSEQFIEALLELYASTGLRPERVPLFKEAHALHRERHFGGAVTLLYSQIEGVLTDALLELGHARTKGTHVVSTQGDTLTGLHAKLELAKNHLETTSEVFRDLLEGLLVASDPGSTVPKTRNAVLHGSDVTFATRARSTQIFLWLAAILTQLLSVLPATALPQERGEKDRKSPAPEP